MCCSRSAPPAGSLREQDLGDVVVTRAAKFRLQDEFKNESFNDKTYKSDWKIPTTHFADATSLMAAFKDNIQEPPEFIPPTVSFTKPAGRISQARPTLQPRHLARWPDSAASQEDAQVPSDSYDRLL